MGGLTLLRTYLDLEEAMVVRSLLEAEGFAVVLDSEHLHHVNPMTRFALGGCRVLVCAAEADAADVFLRSLESEAARQSMGSQRLCPACGASAQRRKSRLWAAVGLIQGVPYAPETVAATCRRCGFGMEAESSQKDLLLFLLAVLILAGLLYGFFF